MRIRNSGHKSAHLNQVKHHNGCAPPPRYELRRIFEEFERAYCAKDALLCAHVAQKALALEIKSEPAAPAVHTEDYIQPKDLSVAEL